jgi:hypothetical protein
LARVVGDFMNEFVLILLAVSLTGNVILGWNLWAMRKRPRPEAYDVQELMTDLLRGQALVKVERISPADVLLRSPRGRA